MKENWHNFKDKFKRYGKFSREEIKTMAICTIVFAFILSFDQWGIDTFDLAKGIINLFISIIICGVGVLIQHLGHRVVGLSSGFRVETKLWWYGLAIGLIVCLITNGKLMIFAGAGIWIHHLAYHRLGFFRYGTNYKAFMFIALGGPVANVLFGTFFKQLANVLPLGEPITSLFHQIFIFNLWMAAWNLIPIPPLAGSRIIFWSRLTYVFLCGTIIAYAVLVSFEIYSYILAIFIGTVAWALYYIFYEHTHSKHIGG